MKQLFDSLNRSLAGENNASFSPKELAYIRSLLQSPVVNKEALYSLDASTIFDNHELKILDDIWNREPCSRGMRPHTFLIVKATRLCNLRCTYCHSWNEGPGQIMPFSILAKAISDSLRCEMVRRLDVVWHGGEVTTLPVKYFRKALWVQEHFRQPHQIIVNSLQTNATRLTDEWIELFRDFDFKVGVSIDAPRDVHDSKRIYASGRSSWRDVKNGIHMLSSAGIEFGTLAVIGPDAVKRGPIEFLNNLIDLGIKGVALLNVIPENTEHVDAHHDYLPWSEFVAFLQDLFPVWWRDFRDRIVVRELNALVENVKNRRPTICEFAGNCMGQFLTVDPNGDVSACDKYIGDSLHVFGNLTETELPQLLQTSENLLVARTTAESGIREMRSCKYYKYCNGGCPHDVRLNRLHVRGWNAHCCGMSSLLQDICEIVQTAEN